MRLCSPSFLELQRFWSALKIVKNFFLSIFEKKIFSELFARLDTKIRNIFELIFVSNKRKIVSTLFNGENWQKTQKIARVFLGLPSETNKFLFPASSLFSYLTLKFAGDPEKIVKNFEELTKEVEKKNEQLSNKKGKYQHTSQSNLPKYSLTHDWLDCALDHSWLWWRCSNDKTDKKVSISSETSNSLAKFFD